MILGLTGAIGSGKSAVLDVFHRRNWKTVDADKLCHDVYLHASDELLDALKKSFGSDCVNPDRSVDRKKIAERVFGNREKLDELTALIIPEFENEFEKFVTYCRSNEINAICEVPLLFEKGYQDKFDAVIAIWTPDDLRHERLKKMRNMDDEYIRKRESQQLSPEKKIELADFCVVNDSTLEEVEKQVTEIIGSLNLK
ncbi:MAG: dephospho-CoA kinase [Lentisphaeria bacterium]|nr:dephospho-CoA kinase [Lentisphaeria bacterium]